MNQPLKDRLKYLEENIENQRAYMDYVGASISIFNKNEILFAKGFGYSNIEEKIPATEKTMYRVASITKLFTTTAVMQLVEKGLVELQKPFAHYVPWFEFSKNKDLNQVSTQNLLNHSAGIPRESAHPYWITLDFPDQKMVENGLKEQEQVLPKNTMWKYSNLGFAFLGELIKNVSGQSYESYVEENVINQLGLSSSSIKSINTSDSRLAIGYSRKFPNQARQPVPVPDCNWIGPAANLSSNVLDLSKFLQSYMNNNGVLLKPETVREMLKVTITNHNWTDGYGLGFKHLHAKNRIEIGHGGAYQGYKSYAYFLKDHDLGVIVLTNSTDSAPVAIARQIYDCLVPSLSVKSQESKNQIDLEKYIGRFRNAWRDFCILPIDGELCLLTLTDNESFESRAKIKLDDNNEFRLESKSGGDLTGEKVTFEFDEQGQAIKMFLGSSYSNRIEKW